MEVVVVQVQSFEVRVGSDLWRDYAFELVVVQIQTLQVLRARQSGNSACEYARHNGRSLTCEPVAGQIQCHKARQPAQRCWNRSGQEIS